MTAIITYIPADTQMEFCVRTMRNVDDQSIRDWHHYVFCETEEMRKRIQSVLSLRSEDYREKVMLAVDAGVRRSIYSEIVQKNYQYFTIHPVRDSWTPYFLKHLTTKLENAPETVVGVWAQYNTVYETTRNKTITIDRTTPGPQYTEQLLIPALSSIETVCYIQGLYTLTALPEDQSIHHMHPLLFAAGVITEHDILTIPEVQASHSILPTANDALQFQQIRNQVYRTYPRLIV